MTKVALNHRMVKHRALLGLSVDLPLNSLTIPLIGTTPLGSVPPASAETTSHTSGGGGGGASPPVTSNPSPVSPITDPPNPTSTPTTSGDQNNAQNSPQNSPNNLPLDELPTDGAATVSLTGTQLDLQTIAGIAAGASVVQNAAVKPSDDGVSLSDNRMPNLTGGIAAGTTATATSPGAEHNGSPVPTFHDPAGGPTSNSPNDATISHKKAFPSYALGILITLAIIGSGLVTLVLLRRRCRRRREIRRTRWMPVMEEGNFTTPSVRSSFATNFDQGISPVDDAPTLPPPVLVTSSSLSDVLDSQQIFVDIPFPAEAEHLGQPLPSPISVRPFSPSESYSFPRPPSHGPFSPNTSNATLIEIDELAVKRPFAPGLPDELEIKTGEKVQVIDVYDDGWALVAKPNHTKGLIPLACFEVEDDCVDIRAFRAQHLSQ